MKGNQRVIDALNRAIVGEQQAFQQYYLNSKILKRIGLSKAAQSSHQESMEEIEHMGKLMERVLFLEGEPVAGEETEVVLDTALPDQIERALALEQKAVQTYSDLVDIAESVGDYGTRDLATEILQDEERHVQHLEQQQSLIQMMGLENYLSTQS